MIRVIRCSDCGATVHESEVTIVHGPHGRERLCPSCRYECDEPTLPNAEQVLWQLREGTGVGL